MNAPDFAVDLTRRHFFGRGATGLGIAGLAHLLGRDAAGMGGLPGLPHLAAKAKHVIYLFQSGGPSQLDLFDYKPTLDQLHGTELPDSVRRGQRLTGMTASQKSFAPEPVVMMTLMYPSDTPRNTRMIAAAMAP